MRTSKVSEEQALGRIVRIPSIEQIEEKFKEPAASWEGRCAELAACVEKMIPGCRRVRGHYLGLITGSHWKGRPYAQHEWLELEDGTVVDPTRWSFEGKDPYVFVGGPTNTEDWPYDEAGVRLRHLLLGRKPCPAFSKDEESAKVNQMPSDARRHLEKMGAEPKNGRFSLSQLFWIAGAAPEELGDHVVTIYRWFVRNNYEALIPIDLRRKYLR